MDLEKIPRVMPVDRPSPPAYSDPDFHRAADWLAEGNEERPQLVVFGAPYAGGSISKAKCDRAPSAVRRALERFSTFSSDFDVSLDRLSVIDLGDLPPAFGVAVEEFQLYVEEAAGAVRAQTHATMVVLGGDNSISVGAFRGAGADALITFDAHHDLRRPIAGHTNGSVVRQLIDGGLEGSRIFQIGVHGFANASSHARFAADVGITVVGPPAVRTLGIDSVLTDTLNKLEASGAERIWVDVDLDSLERALAPAAPAAMPGGLWPADLERAAFRLGHSPLVTGMDITELDPTVDVADATTRAACSVLLAFAAGVAIRA